MDVSRSLTFQSERFDYVSDLPEEYNAGNRFYGKDVAEMVAKGLSSRGFAADFLDEDWGWLVFATREAADDFEVAVYNLSEHREGGRPGANRWGLWVRQHESRKVLGFFTRRVEVPVDLPPPGRTSLKAVKSVNLENDGHEEEQIHRRTDHQFH